MNLANFRFETDADGIALVTWDMPDRSMNVLTPEVIAELSTIVDKISSDASIKGAVFTSGKDGFSGGADLSMLQTAGEEYARLVKTQGERGGDALLRRPVEAIVADLPAIGNLRQTDRRGDQRHMHGRRLRARARLPPSRRRRYGHGARRASGDQGRTVPWRRRNAARRAAHADAGRAADAARRAIRSAPPPRRRWVWCTRSRRPIRSSRSPRPG